MRRRVSSASGLQCTLTIIVFGIFILAVFNEFIVLAENGGDDNKVKSSLYLYKDDVDAQDLVHEYTGKEMMGDFFTSDHPRIVEFYNPYCGACRNYKKQYIEEAKSFREIYPNIEFYAVSCAAHNDLCRSFGIMGVPSLLPIASGTKLNHPTEATSSIEGVGKKDFLTPYTFKLKKAEEVLGLTEDDKKATSSSSSSEERTLEEDHDDKMNEDDKKEMDAQLAGYLQLAGDVERNAKILKNFSKKHRNPKDVDKFREILEEKIKKRKSERFGHSIRREHMEGQHFSGKREHPREEIATEGSTELMRAFKPGTKEFLMKKQKLREDIQKLQKKRKGIQPLSIRGDEKQMLGKLPYKKIIPVKQQSEKIPIVKRFVRLSKEEELMLDVTLSFVKSLEFGLFRDMKPLPPSRKQAFNDWLDLLTISLPPEWGLVGLVSDLRKNIDDLSRGYKYFDQILKRHEVPRQRWSKSCAGKDGQGSNGLNCGFWKLLHVVTVGTAETRGGLNLIESGMIAPEMHVYSPLETADVIRNYIHNFFHCDECAKHFTKQYDDCERNDRCDRLVSTTYETTDSEWKETAKWLWEVHNEISVRVSHEKASGIRKGAKKLGTIDSGNFLETPEKKQDPERSVAVLWPNIYDCMSCLREDGTWDEDEVFLRLERTYWYGDIEILKNTRSVVWYGDEGPTGRGFALFWIVACLVLAYYLRDSWTSMNLQRTVYQAKSTLTTTLNPEKGAGKRAT